MIETPPSRNWLSPAKAMVASRRWKSGEKETLVLALYTRPDISRCSNSRQHPDHRGCRTAVNHSSPDPQLPACTRLRFQENVPLRDAVPSPPQPINSPLAIERVRRLQGLTSYPNRSSLLVRLWERAHTGLATGRVRRPRLPSSVPTMNRQGRCRKSCK